MVGDNIKALRTRAGRRFTQNELAEAVTAEYKKLTGKEQTFYQSTISDIEIGERSLKIEELAAFANVFGVLPSDLMRDYGERTSHGVD